MSEAPASLMAVRVGKVAPLGPEHVPSGFVKHSVAGPVAVTTLGLEGDQQADLEVHGGPEKAVYGYAVSHYSAWQTQFPGIAAALQPGAMGENLCITGLDETGVCVGDVHGIGTALLQVCQPRRPCFKLALRHGNPHLPRAMVENGFSGWYYRVLRTGALAAGDAVTLQDRPQPDFRFDRLVEIINYGKASLDELRQMVEMPELASQWRRRAQALLDR